MYQIVNFVVFSYVRNDFFRKLFGVFLHISFDLIYCRSDRSLYFGHEFVGLLELLDWELKFSC